jgi:hypothetical protein
MTIQNPVPKPKPKTHYGHMCGTSYVDYDGGHETAEWIEPADQGGEPDQFRCPDSLGWYAECQVEPEFHFVGPFKTEEEAIRVATNESAFLSWVNSPSTWE